MADIFDNTVELPNSQLEERALNLIGFDNRFNRIFNNLKLLLDQEGIKKWSEEKHGVVLPAIKGLFDRHPLVIMEGDAGTGKTASAECIANRVVKLLGKEGYFLKLSTRVRGEGLHGEMGNLVNNAFDNLKTQAGKKRIAFLFIDEADAIATTRGTMQMHQEEKSAVNTLIQKIDEVRQLEGRAIIFMSTNRLHYLDEAIVRRAAVIMKFERPNYEERNELFTKDLSGLKLTTEEINELSELTGSEKNNGLGYSFSDLRLKIIPEAISKAYPENALSFEILKEVIQIVKPSPEIK
jgi:AAA+ superfamily predicted ATPase